MPAHRIALACLTPLLSVSVVAVPLVAQTGVQPRKEIKKPGAPKLDRDQVAKRLDKFRASIASKMVPPKVSRHGKRKVARWLAGFHAVHSKHYLVYTNGPKATCKKFGKSLEKLYGFIQKRFPFTDPNHHLECYIFKTEGEYYQFCVDITGWSMAQAQATAGHAMSHYYATYYQSPTADTVMHEAAHQVVGACLKVPGVGSWFQEGIAVYIEKKIGNANVSGGMKSDLRRGNFYSLPHLVRLPSLLSDRNGHRNYDHAGTVIEFLVETRLAPIKGRFPEFLRAARRGYARGPEITERLFQKVYGLSIAEVGGLWKKHFKAPKAQPKLP